MSYTQFAEEFDVDLFDFVMGYDDILEEYHAKADALHKEEKE